MNNSNEYDELLIRYLLQEGTEEEQLFVENWLSKTEENRRHFTQLLKVWKLTELQEDLVYLTDKIDLDEKWNCLEQNINNIESKAIAENEVQQAESKYQHIPLPATSRPLIYKLLVAVSIAASVLLLVGLGWKFLGKTEPGKTVVQDVKRKTDTLLFAVRREVNFSGKERQFQLPDGSLIRLANNSEISYNYPFSNQRNIVLKGQAFFKVAKDKTRPFTVLSGNITTTALGTQFTVVAFEKAKQITVSLFEGKVAIRLLRFANKQPQDLAVLLPKQQFIYNIDGTYSVANFASKSKKDEVLAGKNDTQDVLMMPSNTKGTWYMFNNQHLPDVLDQLAAIYGVEIAYDKRSLANIYFTGKYEKTDSLGKILQELAVLHNLKIVNEGNKYTIEN